METKILKPTNENIILAASLLKQGEVIGVPTETVYGLAGDLPIAFLDDLSAHGICLMIHRRNMPHPLIMYTSFPTDLNDLLTKQILYRENNIKRVYISRAFLLKRFDAFTLIPEVADRGSFQLNKAKDIVTLRTIEAEVTAKFWKKWAATSR